MTKFDKEKLEGGYTITKQGNFRKNKQTRYKSICKLCGKEFLGVKDQTYCSRKCSGKNNNVKSIKYKDVLELFESVDGYQVITTEDEWNNRTKSANYFKIKFICPEGHNHFITYSNFYRGQRCGLCAKNAPVKWVDVINLFEKEKGWTVLTKENEWFNAGSIVKFQCEKGHTHSYTYTSLKYVDSGCPYCNNNVKIEFKDIKKWFEDEDWTVLTKENEYISQNKTPIDCICPNGHRQTKNVRKWRMGRRCPYCVTSGPELEIKKFLIEESNNIKFVENDRNISMELDIYFPSLNKAIEFNGDYWHCNPSKYDRNYYHKHKNLYAHQIWERDIKKKMLCEENGIELMIVWENDWNADKNQCKKGILEFINSRK